MSPRPRAQPGKQAQSGKRAQSGKQVARVARGDHEQHRLPDSYATRARASGYRSRAVYKLIEIDQRDRLLRPGSRVLDLGAAPGGWSQYAAERVGAAGLVLSIDHTPLEPIPGVCFLAGEIGDPKLYPECREVLGARPCDLVLSDLSPGLSGIRDTDQARMSTLAEQALELALQLLKADGHLLIKVFQGGQCEAFRSQLQEHFHRVTVRKPGASRDRSREFYLLAHALRGSAAP